MRSIRDARYGLGELLLPVALELESAVEVHGHVPDRVLVLRECHP
jgi:hypothetical protein